MTVQLPTNETYSTERATDAVIGVDLTLLGAVCSEAFTSLGIDLPVERASLPKLASCIGAACTGGLDFVSLSKDFQARSDRTTCMDAVRTVSRIMDVGAVGFSAEIPPEAEHVDEAVSLLAEQKDGWGCVEIDIASSSDLEQIAKYAKSAHDAGVQVTARVACDLLSELDIDLLASWADMVRLLTDDPHEARGARFALRSAAHQQGRELRVLVEVGIVISGNQQAANERAILIEAMNGSPAFAGKASVVGTVYDVADLVESWIGLGAADGVVFLPASVPTDLASVIRGVLPLLRARSEA
ncbi:hypothetical protein [Ancrocorticia populi]|uniref:Uncharacterized protein n=1 Tax=Ancrocorticia populi TaxID=2175228 RepID=A0A2V1KBB1_9ACTO|nr:hypothetical protein [Ancrocorticia populi]PWF27715.1 hypothetical protein DD236_04925 [Ancrocorticia populi]